MPIDLIRTVGRLVRNRVASLFQTGRAGPGRHVSPDGVVLALINQEEQNHGTERI